jgi:hypothetical protein
MRLSCAALPCSLWRFFHRRCAIPSIAARPAAPADDFGNCQFRYAARIAEGGIEDGHPALRCRLHIHLIRADTETANRHQVRRRLQHTFADVGLRPDPEDVHIGQPLDQLLLGKRSGVFFDPADIARAKCLFRNRMNVFQKDTLIGFLDGGALLTFSEPF